MKTIKTSKNAKVTIYIKRGYNTQWGNYISIYAQDNEDWRVYGNYKEEYYSGYSLRDAINKYRKDNNLFYKHCDIVEFN